MGESTRIVTDLNGRIVEASAGAANLIGISDRWIVGKPLAAFVAEAQRRDFRTVVLELSNGGGPTGLSLSLLRRDGIEVPVDVEAAGEAAQSRLEWVFAAAAESEVPQPAVPDQLAPVSVNRLLARLPIGVLSLDSDLKVEYLNAAARVFLGKAGVGNLVPDPWPGFSLRKFAQRLFGAVPPPRQVVETASGRLLELDGIHASEGQSALLLLQDVTSRERQRRAERDFVTNAAHELKTPIAAIASSLEVLQGGAKETPEDRDLFLGHLEHESDRLARLVAALLLLARIQTGQATPSLELADLAPLLEDIALRMRPKPGVEVHVSCDQGVAAFVDVDLLRQVVWNLAVNSTNHTHHGEIVLSGRDLGRLSEIEVRDSGSGIAEDQQSLVFDRFFRAEQHSAAGFGLGLPLVREIVGALGGSVSLDSQLGEGTRVRVLVPSARLVRA